MSSPIVSVIVPCFNRGQYLADTLDSLLAQSYHAWECVVVDDGSTDDSAEVASRYCGRDSRFLYVAQPNRGLSAARNTGLRKATGRLVQFLDSDDKIERDKLSQHVSFLFQNHQVGIVYGDVRYFRTTCIHERALTLRNSSRVTRPWIPELWAADGTMLMKLASRNQLAVNCPLVRREVFDKVGLWNEALRAAEDWEYWIRCAANNIRFQFIDIPNTLALVRAHEESMSWEPGRMDNGTFAMRVAVAKLVSDRSFRLRNCKRGISDSEALGPQGRTSRLWDLWRATNMLSAAVPIVTTWLFGTYGPGYSLRVFIGRFVPQPVKKMFLRLIN